MKKYILGIDQGTTGTKSIIFDRASNIVSSSYSEFTQYYPKPGWVEHDPEEIWQVTLKTIKGALADAGIGIENIASIGITNQRLTTTFWDRDTGEPAGRSVVWQDRRTLDICEYLLEKDGDGIESRTGAAIVPNASATKIKWLLDNNESIRNGVKCGKLIFGTIDTWLIWKLTGGKVHVTDYSNAAATLLQNAKTLTYDEYMLEELGIPSTILPELKGSSEIYGYTDESILGASIPIAGIAGDQQAAAFGQSCTRKGMAKNTYGTGSFLIFNTGDEYIPPKRGIMSPVLWSVDSKATYGLEGYADASGAAIQWLRDGLGIIDKSAEVEQLAATVEDTAGVYFVPAFVGLGSPYFDSYARGTIFGLTRGTSKAHIARAALESMAFQVMDALTLMEKVSGTKLEVLRVDGGGAKNDFLMQFQADILGIPVERPVVTETTCLGAAYLAGLAVGYWESIEEIEQNWKLDKRFEPQISAEERKTLYNNWNKAIQRSSGWLK